jgi:FLVCR family MFS transporter 7
VLYGRRWFVLAVVCVLNFSNAMTWITFAPITYYTNEYYGNSSAAMWLNAVFMICSIPFGVLAMWSVDRFGLRAGCSIGAWTNCIGNLIRLLASAAFMPTQWRFPLVLVGQMLAACGQPFIMYLSTKLASFWFPDHQRAIANTLASMSNPLGIASMYSLSPLIVNDSHPDVFFLLTLLVAIPATVIAFISLTITRSRPPTPPAASVVSTDSAPPFWTGVKMAMHTPSFLVLSVTLGGGIGLFNSLYNNLQPMLCVKGYSNTFSGALGSLLIVSGLIGAALAGIYVDRTKRFEEAMKVCFAIAGIAACNFCMAVQLPDVPVWVAASVGTFGFFGFAIYPIGLEVGVETTYPVAEATSTGIIIIAGQLQGVVYVLLTSALTRLPSAADLRRQTCSRSPGADVDIRDWKCV